MNETSTELIISMLQEQAKAQAEHFKAQEVANAFLIEQGTRIEEKLDIVLRNVRTINRGMPLISVRE